MMFFGRNNGIKKTRKCLYMCKMMSKSVHRDSYVTNSSFYNNVNLRLKTCKILSNSIKYFMAYRMVEPNSYLYAENRTKK